MLYLVPLIFFCIAFVFSMLGLGGSQLYIPILYWIGFDFKTQAIPLGMLLNVVSSATAATTYTTKRMVDWKAALPFAIAMLIFPPLGAWFNAQLPAKPLIAFFAIFTATAATLMLSGWKPKQGKISSGKRVFIGLSGGGILGLIAGLIGRGGGSFVVPMLYVAGLEAKTAAATSAVVITFSGISSFISHIAIAAKPNWPIWLACTLSIFLGSKLGSHFMSEKLNPKGVRIVFGTVLWMVALFLFIHDVLLK
jgi:uncharacterized membrane protein YfcA